jgi:hypothetical protein
MIPEAWCGNFLPCQSVPPSGINRKSAIPANFGQAMIAEILRQQPKSLGLMLQRGCWPQPK